MIKYDMKNISSFDNPNLLGHSSHEELFLKLYRGGKMPHSIILSGQKGVGKSTFAFRVARFLFAVQNGWSSIEDFDGSLEISPSNPVFEKMEVGGFTDLQYVKRELNTTGKKLANVIKVEQVRKVVESFNTTSSEDGWRIVIVDEVETLNQNAANALLKTLEEPPVKTLFLLVCNNIDAMLDTIKSRCRIFNFQDLNNDDVFDVVKSLKPLVDDETVKNAIYFNSGSVGKTLDFLSSGGIEILEEMKSCVSLAMTGRKALLVPFTQKVSKNPDSFEVFKMLLLTLVYDLIRFSYSEKFGLKFECDLEKLFDLKNKIEKNFELIKTINLEPQSIVIKAMNDIVEVCDVYR